jgi:hypothetical protein
MRNLKQTENERETSRIVLQNTLERFKNLGVRLGRETMGTNCSDNVENYGLRMLSFYIARARVDSDVSKQSLNGHRTITTCLSWLALAVLETNHE